MPLSDYFETFFLQIPCLLPDGFDHSEWKLRDNSEFLGLYIQNSSDDLRRADALSTSSTGTFITNCIPPLKKNDVIRRANDNLFLRITSLPVNSPNPALSQFQKMNVKILEAVT